MKNGNVVWTSNDEAWRVVEYPDSTVSFDDLCGDMYKPELHPDIPKERILEELAEFRDLVGREGVFGYVLERWNPAPNKGWEHVDSCWGFVGSYSPEDRSGLFDHYIVREMIETAKEQGAA